jgi:protocatechuate 3,4-dioxygenase, alpha subunit
VNLIPSSSQTVGPFFHFALTQNTELGWMVADGAAGERIRLAITVFDGDGVPVEDAMIELWQADAGGKYDHPEDSQDKIPDPAFRGFGRLATGEDGACVFQTVRPGRVEGQAPHINVTIFARGLLRHLWTRIYFEGDAANQEDAVLNLVPAERRETLMARPDPDQPGAWRFDIRFCGEGETGFFDI